MCCSCDFFLDIYIVQVVALNVTLVLLYNAIPVTRESLQITFVSKQVICPARDKF